MIAVEFFKKVSDGKKKKEQGKKNVREKEMWGEKSFDYNLVIVQLGMSDQVGVVFLL